MPVPCCLLLLAFATVALASPAFAQSSDAEREARAQALFDAGRTLYEQHQLAAAVEAFVASDRLEPTPNNAFNIAQTYELIGRYDEAFNWYQRYLDYDLEEDRVAAAVQRASELLDRVAVLEITVVPAEAELSIDGSALEAATRATRSIAVAAGAHRVEARATGRQPGTVAVDALIGRRVAVTLELALAEGILSVDSTPRGALVLRSAGLAPLGQTPLRVSMPPQELHLVLRLDGYRDQDAMVRVEAERTSELALTLQKRAALAASPPRRRAGLGAYRWVGYSAAAALLATGIGFGIAAIDKKNEVESDQLRGDRSAVGDLNLAADITAGTGVAIAIATLVLDVGVFGIGPVYFD